jgi:hypothetical protein
LDGLGPEIPQADLENIPFGVGKFDRRCRIEGFFIVEVPENALAGAPDAPTHNRLGENVHPDEQDEADDDLNGFGHDELNYPSDEVVCFSVGPASCRYVIVAGSHSHKGDTSLPKQDGAKRHEQLLVSQDDAAVEE